MELSQGQEPPDICHVHVLTDHCGESVEGLLLHLPVRGGKSGRGASPFFSAAGSGHPF